MSITTHAMVINLQIGIWQGYRLDKDASSKVVRDAGADSDAARVNKHLVPKEALADVVSAAGAVRTHLYLKTLPWKDNGDRMLTRKMFLAFIEEHEQLVTAFNEAVSHFLNEEYPKARDQAEFRMGALFKSEDYPSAADLRRRFYINLDIDPVSEVGDFRVQLDEQHAERVRSEMERAMNERLTRAMTDIYTRLSEVIGHFAKKMADGKAVFRDTTVSNITDLIDLIPGLNVTNDPQLNVLAAEIRAKLGDVDPKDLRKDPAVRSQAAKDADAIMAKMAGFMNATTPATLAA